MIDRDRATTRLVYRVADGERNRNVEILATGTGLEIDEQIFIEWDWILAAEKTVKRQIEQGSPR